MKKSLYLLPLCSLLFSMGCMKKAETASVKGMDMPPWALNQPDLCGVGMVKFRGNLGAAKSAAESRARVDISKQIETKVKAMVKDYISEGGNPDGDFSEEQIDQTSKTLSKQTLNGAVPKKAYVSQKAAEPHYYALVCLNPGVLTDAINNMKQLGDAQRRALARRAQRAHEEMENEMDKYDDM